MLKSLVKNKLREFNKTYEHMEKSRKMILLGGIFVGVSVILMQTFMFPSVDKNAAAIEKVEGLESQKTNITKDKEMLLLKNAYKTEKSLLKQKSDLLHDIDTLLKSNEKSNYIPSDEVPQLIEKVVRNVGQVKIVSFNNIPNAASNNTENKSSILIKHNFNMKISGSFQGMYDVLTSLEQIKGINISMVEVEVKKEKESGDSISTNFNFYVMNTNKNILNF